MAGRRRDCRGTGVIFEPGIHKHLAALWHKHDGKCFYTGKQMNLRGYHTGDPDVVTVDRVNPELGYVTGNVVLCRQIINRMKYNMNYQQFLAMCEEVLAKKREV